jgi:hypothetical protein
MTLSFLLNATDDQQDYITEIAVGTDPNSTPIGPTCTEVCASTAQVSMLGEMLDSIDPTLLLASSSQGGTIDADCERSSGAEGRSYYVASQHSTALAAQIDSLAADLLSHAQSRPQFRSSYNAVGFRSFFTGKRLRRFGATFCRKRHYQYPILHWPSFILEEAISPLLLVVGLTGAAYSYGFSDDPENFIHAREFFAIADSYVFSQLNTFLDQSPSPAETCIGISTALQLCQAALLMYGLDTLLVNNEAVQFAAAARRLPTLVTAIRQLGFTTLRHMDNEDWHEFRERECIIRLVTWTFCADSLATLVYNRPPLLSALEMTGELPCDADLWDAEWSATSNRPRSTQPVNSLRDLVSDFLDREKTPRPDIPLFHLQAVMCGKPCQEPMRKCRTRIIVLIRWLTHVLARFPADHLQHARRLHAPGSI